MSEIFGRETEKRKLASMLSRHDGGVLGYYGLSGLGNIHLLVKHLAGIPTIRMLSVMCGLPPKESIMMLQILMELK